MAGLRLMRQREVIVRNALAHPTTALCLCGPGKGVANGERPTTSQRAALNAALNYLLGMEQL